MLQTTAELSVLPPQVDWKVLKELLLCGSSPVAMEEGEPTTELLTLGEVGGGW
jgi:hypothetical protein